MGTRDRPVVYEPHPVSRERKAELRARGFNIVDSKFAPPAVKQQTKRKSETEPKGVS